MTLPCSTPSKPDDPLLPWPLQHAAERLLAGAELRAPAVVLEAREDPRRPSSSRRTSIATLPMSREPSSERIVSRSTSPRPGMSSSPSW